ncbi:MAG: hypothetical protein R3C68_11130 [Myxococcota bacterium]
MNTTETDRPPNNVTMQNRKRTVLLTLLFTCIVATLALTLTWDRLHPDLFRRMVSEDGPFEWLTVLFLVGSFLYCLRTSWSHGRRHAKPAMLTFAVLALACLFGAGEEISWGQRIFDIPTPDWLATHNRQRETNLHNLVLGGVSINRLVFSTFLGVGIALYFFVLPWTYKLSDRVRRWLAPWYIPLARPYHNVLLILIVTAVALMNDPRKWEICEALGCLVFFLVLIDPARQDDLPTSP